MSEGKEKYDCSCSNRIINFNSTQMYIITIFKIIKRDDKYNFDIKVDKSKHNITLFEHSISMLRALQIYYNIKVVSALF